MKLTIRRPGEPDQVVELKSGADVRLSYHAVSVDGVNTSDVFQRVEVQLEGPVSVSLEAAQPLPPPGEFKSKQLESFPLGRHVEPGFPPAPRVMLTVPDSSPEPEPTKRKTSTRKDAA